MNKLYGLFGGYMPCAVVFHPRIVTLSIEGNEVAPARDIVFVERYILSCRLYRCPAGIVFLRVVTENGHITDIAAGMHALWDCPYHANDTFLCKCVYVLLPCNRERRAAFQLIKGIIGHPVAL